MLRITNVRPTVEYQNQKASVEMHSPNASIQIDTQKAQMSVENQPVKLQIDTSAQRESLGLYGPVRASAIEADKGRQAVLEAIGETGDLWRTMIQPGAGREELAQMAKALTKGGMGEYEVVFTPAPPDISWLPPSIDVSWTPHQLDISWQTNPQAQLTYNPYQFTISATPYSVSIEYLGEPKTGGDVLRALR